MTLLVQNTIFGDSQEFVLVYGEYVLGRSAPDSVSERMPDIVLQTRFASERQAVLTVAEDKVLVRHAGMNTTLLNNVPLAFGQNRSFAVGDELRIGEYIVLLTDTQPRESVSEADNASALQHYASTVEGELHSRLLDLMDIRRSTASIDRNDSETRKKIKRHLDNLVTDLLQSLEENTRRFLARQALYRRLNSKITATSEDGTEVGSRKHEEFENVFEEGLLEQLELKMMSALGLELSPGSMRSDSDLLDAGFADVYKTHQLDLSEGSLDYLVAMYFKRNILDLIFGFGPLQDLLDTPSISEIMVVSRDKIFIEKFGVVEDSRRSFHSDALLMSVIEKIVSPVGRRIDKSEPYVDARLPDGSRVNAIIPPLAVKGPCLTIRKFATVPITIDKLVEFGALDEYMKKFLKSCVENHLNVVVSGGTGSGKTTMLNCLSSFISESERIITIEDTAELQLKQDHVVTLEARAANMEGTGEVSMRDLVKNSLRMRPDRIVVGECRGGETLDMLQAMNTGHDGSMTTAHANSPIDMMKRLETMVLTGIDMPVSAIRNQIVSAVNIVVQLNRLSSGARKVTHISEVHSLDFDTGEIIVEDVFVFNQTVDGGYHAYTGYIPTFMGPMVHKGLIDPAEFF